MIGGLEFAKFISGPCVASLMTKIPSPWQASLWLIAAFSAIRLLVGSASGLSVDEAHYALYGLHLDWSYFDHPPLVGWLNALVLPFSESTLALRVLPVSLFAATGVVLYRLTLRLFPQETPWLGFISVALLQSGLMFQLLGIALVPDTLLLLLGLLVLLALHGALTTASTRYWLALGLLLGLAALSKYTAISLVATVLIALAFTRQWRQLLTPAAGLAVVLAGLALLPILYWNATHEWISFAYQLHHGTGKLHWKVGRFLLSEAVQLVVYGFGVFVFGVIALVAAARETGDNGVRYCLALALPVLLLFGMNAGFEPTLPHWTALAWAAILPLSARWIHRHWSRRTVRVGVYASGAFSLLLMLVLFAEMLTPRLPFADNRHPLNGLYGWQEAAQRAEQLRSEMAATPGITPMLFTGNWTYASRLAWYARPTPVIVLDQRIDQFDLWFGSPQHGARGIVVVAEKGAAPATGGAARFAACTLRDKLPIILNDHLVSTFSFYACHDFQK